MGFLPAVTVLLVLFLSWLIVRIATVALTMTGVSRDLAQFQALSAFTGAGFTTRESEDIVNHPTRRRIIMLLMLCGNAGIVLAISSVMMSLLQTAEQDHWYDSMWFRIALLLGGVSLLIVLANSRFVAAVLWRMNTWMLQHWAGLELRDYTSLLRLSHDYVVSEMIVHENDWLAGKTLAESQLGSEGVLVLGIERKDGRYLGAPRGVTRIKAGDMLIVYGPHDATQDLLERPADIIGNLRHVMAVTRQLDVLEAEEDAEKEREQEDP